MKMFSSCFSNPDLRRSELSLDAMLQRTSSNSSSSSSPSSQGGSSERRGTKAHTESLEATKKTHSYTHAHTLKWKLPCTDTLACKQLKVRCMYLLLYTCKCGHRNTQTSTYTHRASASFRGYQRDFVSRSSALINLSDVPCYSQPPER